MVKLLPVAGVFISISVLVLFAVGIATNNWVVFQKNDPKLNPLLVNSKLEVQGGLLQQGVTDSTRHIEYAVALYGLWVGCFREHKGALSCAFIGVRCRANVCWTRQTPSTRTKTCLESVFGPLTSCVAFQAVRAIIFLATLVLVLGVSTQIVSLIAKNRSLAMLAGLLMFTEGFLAMIAFAVFYSEEMAKNGVLKIASIGWSFWLIIVSWPLAMLGGIASCCAASRGLKDKEISDYSASNY